MTANAGRAWAALAVSVALVAGAVAPISSRALPPTSPAATSSMTAAQSAAVASDDAEYRGQLEAAANSLKADIQAQSDASAAEVSDSQSGPTGLGMIVAGGVVVFAILVSVIVIPASLRARRKRREMVADMISGKPRRKR